MTQVNDLESNFYQFINDGFSTNDALIKTIQDVSQAELQKLHLAFLSQKWASEKNQHVDMIGDFEEALINYMTEPDDSNDEVELPVVEDRYDMDDEEKYGGRYDDYDDRDYDDSDYDSDYDCDGE